MKIIRGYPSYKIDEDGNIYNKRGNILKSYKNQKGYYRICLYDDNHSRKIFCVHRLVAINFIPNPNNLPEVNHKDGNKENNNVNNLEWCTGSENIKHAIKTGLHYIPSKLTKEQVIYIKNNYKARDKIFGRKALANKFGISIYTIDGIIYNHSWKEIML